MVPLRGGDEVGYGFYGFNGSEGLVLGEGFAWVGEFDEDDFSELFLGVVGYA